MGAAVFAAVGERQVTIAGLAGISLEEYASCLNAQLGVSVGTLCSVQVVHVSNVRRLIQDLADPSQPRFGELVPQTKHCSIDGVKPVSQNAASAEGSALASSLLGLAA